MSKINKWIHATWISITMALGVQYARPPTMDTSTLPAIVHAVTTPTPGPQAQAVTPTPSQDTEVKPLITYGQIVGATSDEIKMIKKGTDEANQVLGSHCFENAVMTFNFTERNIGETTTELTNAQILERLGAKPITFGVNVFNGTWYQNYVSKTMGYDIGDGVVYISRLYFDSAETAGSLIIHEAEGHGQGFHHYYVFSTSIPYKFNDFFDLCLGKP